MSLNSGCHIIEIEEKAALGEMANGVAHELNNPLTSVLATAELMLEDMPAESAQTDDIKAIINEAKRMKTSLSNLLGYSRNRIFTFNNYNLHNIIDNALETIGSARIGNIEIKKDYSKKIPNTKMSKYYIEEVFINIISNAIDCMENSGKITITTSLSDNNIIISVKDQGTGILKNNIQKIFEPYYTTKDKKGTGLGLSTSYMTMVRHNGRIEAYSDGLGTGTEIIVTLPVIETGTASDKKIILVIDDEQPVRNLCKRIMDKIDIDVHVAASAEEGYELIKKNNYSLVFLDIIMPGMSGLELLEIVNKEFPFLIVVVLSGSTGKINTVKAFNLGAKDYISKPFEVTELRDIVIKYV